MFKNHKSILNSQFSILNFLVCVLSLSSCVSMREYEALQSHYTQASKSLTLAKQEMQELRDENATGTGNDCNA